VNGIFAGHTPLQAAAQNGHIEIIRLLIQHDVNFEIEVTKFFYMKIIVFFPIHFRIKMVIELFIMLLLVMKLKY
jgi:ankyrin repeat protein